MGTQRMRAAIAYCIVGLLFLVGAGHFIVSGARGVALYFGVGIRELHRRASEQGFPPDKAQAGQNRDGSGGGKERRRGPIDTGTELQSTHHEHS